MGCCFSKKAAADAPQGPLLAPEVDPVPRSVSITHAVSHAQQRAPGALLLHAFDATAPASFPYQTFTTVRCQPGQYIFAALFQGHNGHEAASLAAATCYDFFCSWLAGGATVDAALQHTFQSIDQQFLGDAAIPARVRAAVGASGAIVVVNLAGHSATAARVGACRCVLSKASSVPRVRVILFHLQFAS